ncbi:helicase-associated domain-containing protein [Streptomyces capparidis]
MSTQRTEAGRTGEGRTEEGRADAGTAPRTLAEDLRARDDRALSALLRARPDLLSPVPNDLTQLATRAGTRASVARALERLDRFTLATAEALAVAPDNCGLGELAALLPDAAEDAVARALDTLRERALVWGGRERFRLVRTARDLLAPAPNAPSPTGLGPTLAEASAGISPGRFQEILADAGLPATHDPVSAVAALTALFRDRPRMEDLLGQAPREARDVLAKLTWGPPYGEVSTDARAGSVRAAEAATPVQWLLARGLLLPAGPRTVVLPREVALHLRGGRAHRDLRPEPPALAPRPLTAAAVDAGAAGQAFTAVRTVEELLAGWDTGGPPVLRAGGLGVRDLKRTAAALETGESTAAFWLELAYAAGLLASDGEADERWAPTPAHDEWLRLPAEERWERLAAAWLTGTRVPGLAGEKDAKGRVLNALGPDLDRPLAPAVRRHLLGLLASLPPGAGADPGELLERLRWDRPLRGAAGELRDRLARWALAEAELLGVTGRGALAGHGRALLDGGPAAAALGPLLPEPLDHVLLQADLTAVAPGPLLPRLAAELAVAADVESKGGATVYRFTPESVRRALDAGRTAAELHAFLAEHSRTPVPQPLAYLVDDVARRHGRLRVGAASAYLRCDDDALLAELLADRRCAGLGLRRLAPTVLAARSDPGALLERLREIGYAPAAESEHGDVLVARPESYRTPPRSAPAPVAEGPPEPDETLLGAALTAIRAGDRASTARRRPSVPAPTPGGLPRSAAAETLATVQAAVLAGQTLWIGYVNTDGAATQRLIAPVRVEGGFVTAYDHTTDEVRTFALHRVTGVAELEEEAP